jgi:hypothetical protein
MFFVDKYRLFVDKWHSLWTTRKSVRLLGQGSPPYIASVIEVFQDMENAIYLLYLWIRLLMSLGDSLHRRIRLEKQEQTYIQRDAGFSSHIWRGLGFVHTIHNPYYYYYILNLLI